VATRPKIQIKLLKNDLRTYLPLRRDASDVNSASPQGISREFTGEVIARPPDSISSMAHERQIRETIPC